VRRGSLQGNAGPLRYCLILDKYVKGDYSSWGARFELF
jgi:hypothetical protein